MKKTLGLILLLLISTRQLPVQHTLRVRIGHDLTGSEGGSERLKE